MPIFNGPIANAIREQVRRDHPVIAAAVTAGLREAVADPATTIQQVDQGTVAAVTAQVAPIVENAQNKEPPRQSRVVAGTVPAIASALSTFLAGVATLLGALGPSLALTGPSRWLGIMITLTGGAGSAGSIFALFGRLKANLPPMTYRRYNPFSWFAPRPGAT